MRIVFEKGLLNAIKRQGGIALYANISKNRIRIYGGIETLAHLPGGYVDKHYCGKLIDDDVYMGCVENFGEEESKEGVKHILYRALCFAWENRKSREFLQENGILDENHINRICY